MPRKKSAGRIATPFLIAVLSLFLGSGVFAQVADRRNSLLVRREGPPHRNAFLIDFDGNLAWMGRHYGSHCVHCGNTNPGVLVYSKSHDIWLQIVEVSTAGATFGKSPDDVMIAAPWDFSQLASESKVPLPLTTGGAIHLPDKVTLDEGQSAYILHFDSSAQIPQQTTKLLIPKQELMDAFAGFSERQ